VALFTAAAIATGQRVFDRPASDPLSVVYFDLEMTESDVAERLEEMGYGPESDLSRLHYYLLPNLPPLDTAEGGAVALSIAVRHAADLIIIDTTSRVLSGEENSSDTLRAFYMFTGLPLKSTGATLWRLDHAGKDPSRGQRGTSAKADDVDLVWSLSTREGGFQLRATHRRQSWVPETVDLVRLEDPLRYELAAELSWPSGTTETAELLSHLGVPLDATTREAQAALKAAELRVRRQLVVAAVKWRNSGYVTLGTTLGTTFFEKAGTSAGTNDEIDTGTAAGTAGTNTTGKGGGFPLSRGEPPPAQFWRATTPDYPCSVCGETNWLKRAVGGWVCATCKPWATVVVPAVASEPVEPETIEL
jgi:hypothetical protein